MELLQYVEDPVAQVESTETNGEYQAGILVDNVDILDLRYGRPNRGGALLDGMHHAWSRRDACYGVAKDSYWDWNMEEEKQSGLTPLATMSQLTATCAIVTGYAKTWRKLGQVHGLGANGAEGHIVVTFAQRWYRTHAHILQLNDIFSG